MQEHLAGTSLGLGNLLGLPLDIDHFLADAVVSQYAAAASSRESSRTAPPTWSYSRQGRRGSRLFHSCTVISTLDNALSMLSPRARTVSLPTPAHMTGGFAPSILAAGSQYLAQLCHPGTHHKESVTQQMSPRPHPLVLAWNRIAYASRTTGTAGRERLWNTYSDLTHHG